MRASQNSPDKGGGGYKQFVICLAILILGCLLGNHLTVQSANGHIYQSEGRLEMQNEGTGERIIIDSADIKENATRLDSYESDFNVRLGDMWADGYENGFNNGKAASVPSVSDLGVLIYHYTNGGIKTINDCHAGDLIVVFGTGVHCSVSASSNVTYLGGCQLTGAGCGGIYKVNTDGTAKVKYWYSDLGSGFDARAYFYLIRTN